MSATTLHIERLDGDRLAIEPLAMARSFFANPRTQEFEAVAGTTRRDVITAHDIGLLNQLMGARSPLAYWEPICGRPKRWLENVDPCFDLVEMSERRWREIKGSRCIERALVGCVGPGRNIAVATKLLHLKRPAFFPILDRLVVELLGARVPVSAEADSRAREAAALVLHLRDQGRANLQALKAVREHLRRDGVDVSFVRILDAVLWSYHPAAGQVASRSRVFRLTLTH